MNAWVVAWGPWGHFGISLNLNTRLWIIHDLPYYRVRALYKIKIGNQKRLEIDNDNAAVFMCLCDVPIFLVPCVYVTYWLFMTYYAFLRSFITVIFMFTHNILYHKHIIYIMMIKYTPYTLYSILLEIYRIVLLYIWHMFSIVTGSWLYIVVEVSFFFFFFRQKHT